jgi:RNA polymerase sigma factor (sigma-70 family)
MELHAANDLFERIADDYCLLILNWAIKKTGSREKGEDLAQEAMYQILAFAKGKKEIEKLDNLIWKIAHRTWCNRLRKTKKDNNMMSLDDEAGIYIIEERDHIDETAENEASKKEQTELRRRIADLSKTQREIIIAYYFEDKSVAEVAEKFGMKKSAVKWHLFDARKKIKERFNMEDNSRICRPGKLHLGTSGDRGPNPDTARVNDNLIRQNICLLCYGDSGRTIDELAEMTGIPKPYLEFDLEWLAEREFLVSEGKKYRTNFGIKNHRHFYEVRDVYITCKESYYGQIIGYINSHEKDIRSLGFYGSDFEWGKLLWCVLTLYLRYFSESEPLKALKKYNSQNLDGLDLELHKDGGRYTINGFDQSEDQGVDLSFGGVLTEPIFEPEKWKKISGIWCSSISETTSEFKDDDQNGKLEYATYWLGIYIFAENPSTLTKNVGQQITWKKILSGLLRGDFLAEGMTDEEKELLAIGVKENIIKKEGEKYLPQFAIFEVGQLERLYQKIFKPLVEQIEPQTMELIERFKQSNGRSLPKKIQAYVWRWTYFDIWDSGIKNFMFAAEDGHLYMPKTPEEGASLTLSFVF